MTQPLCKSRRGNNRDQISVIVSRYHGFSSHNNEPPDLSHANLLPTLPTVRALRSRKVFEALKSLRDLQWIPQPPSFRPLPDHIQRAFVTTEHGDLELLSSRPRQCHSDVPPVFFAHGGYGSAGVWLEFMNRLHHAGYSGLLYAHSIRNHGASCTVSFYKMVYRTSLDACVVDLRACFEYAIKDAGSDDMVVVENSDGGGLLQYALDSGVVEARALGLLNAVSHFGSYGVYWNRLKTDLWLPLRSLMHFQHPTSPLSSDRLIHRAFFGHVYPTANAPDFRRWMLAYESMGWATEMVGDFWAWLQGEPRWLNAKDIVANPTELTDSHQRNRVCIVVAPRT
jgi:pimeloyl-ACP methyl ester carboxylesterase